MPATGPAAATDLQQRARHALRHEADIAFRRRAVTLLGYLDPRPTDVVIDAGCGLGFYLHLIGLLAPCRLLGLEFAADRMADAVADRAVSGATLAQGDVTRLPVASGVADGVLLSEVIEHLHDDAAALREAHRVLKPGGIVAISVPHRDYPGLWDPPNAVRRTLGRGHFGPNESLWSGIWTDHQRLYTPDELAHGVAAAGFVVDRWQLETRWSAPFAHHLVYEVGKALAARGVGGGHRWDLWGDAEPALPLRMAIGAITAPDALNRDTYDTGRAVSLCLRAIKP